MSATGDLDTVVIAPEFDRHSLATHTVAVEAFESFVALALEAEGLVVSEAVKFPVRLRTARRAYEEHQTHGFEVDLIGARANRLVLATVKSFLGSRGVVAEQVAGTSGKSADRIYAMLNNPEVRDGVIAGACERYGYSVAQVEVRLYVGKFAGPKKGDHERAIRQWAGDQVAGSGPIKVFGLDSVSTVARELARSKTYRDNAALMTIKVLDAAGMLRDGGTQTASSPDRLSKPPEINAE